jgi:hypothetical protein
MSSKEEQFVVSTFLVQIGPQGIWPHGVKHPQRMLQLVEASITCAGSNGEILEIFFPDGVKQATPTGFSAVASAPYSAVAPAPSTAVAASAVSKTNIASEGIQNYSKRGPPLQALIIAKPEQYIWLMDLLRNEQIVIATVNFDEPRFNRLETQEIKVGWGHFESKV